MSDHITIVSPAPRNSLSDDDVRSSVCPSVCRQPNQSKTRDAISVKFSHSPFFGNRNSQLPENFSFLKSSFANTSKTESPFSFLLGIPIVLGIIAQNFPLEGAKHFLIGGRLKYRSTSLVGVCAVV